jgi:ribosome-associated protein
MQEYTQNYIRAGGARSLSEYYVARYDGARFAGELVDGVVTVTASERRSQLRNREMARQRLAELIARAIAPPPPRRRPTRPTAASRERRMADKRRRAETKRLRQQPGD